MIITVWTNRIKPDTDWGQRQKPITTYTKRTIPDTNWGQRQKPTTNYTKRDRPYKYITPLKDYVDIVCNENWVIIHIFANEGKALSTIWQTR